jgi:hypothetical protein
MDINDIKHLAVERIYLVPDASEGRLGYAWCDDPAPGLDMDPSEAVEYVRKDVHDAIIKRQASSARMGMNAAKQHGSHMEAEAKRLYAECSPQALESEREANAQLTERIAELEAQVEQHKAAEEMQIKLREKADEREAALARDASYHQQEIDSLLGRLRKTQTERDVHMAHSARVNEVLFKTFSAIEDGDESALPYDEYRDAFNDAPTASLARRDAEVLRKYADMLEAEEAPDAEAGDMWDASQCAEWMREQAEKAEGHQ